jgi:hypothetical protein
MRCHSGEKPARCKVESKGLSYVWTNKFLLLSQTLWTF